MSEYITQIPLNLNLKCKLQFENKFDVTLIWGRVSGLELRFGWGRPLGLQPNLDSDGKLNYYQVWTPVGIQGTSSDLNSHKNRCNFSAETPFLVATPYIQNPSCDHCYGNKHTSEQCEVKFLVIGPE